MVRPAQRMGHSDLPAWAADYIGIPYTLHGRDRAEGLDCYGLVRLVLAERFGIAAPDYGAGYSGNSSLRDLAELMEREAACGWQPVASGREAPGDLLLLVRRGVPLHCGLVVAPAWMLHTEQGAGSVVETYRDAPAWGRQVPTFLRWPAGAPA